jgi:uracil-DNA glycosylase family 4
MNVGGEVKDLLGAIKRQLLYRREIDLDTPCLSAGSLSYLTAELQSERPSLKEDIACKSLDELKRLVDTCDRCKLSKTRETIVFGEGPRHAKLVFVGEAPGVEEDLAGRPFVGAAGKLLNDIIRAMGLDRAGVYICNVVKCHPPRNRDPEHDEIEMCLPFLQAQLSLINPEVICTIGRVSAQSLIDKHFRITRDRGQWYSFMDIPVMPTYHPAYLLRYPQAKRQVWDDVQKIMKKLGLVNPRRVKN